MSFLFKKVANKLRRNMAAYLFLVLEFTLGTSFLIFSRNATLSIQKLQKYYNTNYTNTTISLFNWNSSSTGGAAITTADAREIQRQFPNSQLR